MLHVFWVQIEMISVQYRFKIERKLYYLSANLMNISRLKKSIDSRADCSACDNCVISCESRSSVCRSLYDISWQCIRCVRVVIWKSNELRLYGFNNCVISRRLWLFSMVESFSEVFWDVRIGDLCLIGGLCSGLFSIYTIKEITFAKNEKKFVVWMRIFWNSSLLDVSLSSRGEDVRWKWEVSLLVRETGNHEKE